MKSKASQPFERASASDITHVLFFDYVVRTVAGMSLEILT
jgi:hypothetical protein